MTVAGMTYGFIYCLTNYSMPGICKIGFTDRSPSQRCMELSASTSVPEDFSIQFYAEVMGAAKVERRLHSFFADVRVNPSREFFRCSPVEVYYWLMQNEDIITDHLDGDVRLALSKVIAADSAERAAIQSYLPAETF